MGVRPVQLPWALCLPSLMFLMLPGNLRSFIFSPPQGLHIFILL